MSESRQDLVYLAELAAKSNRYEDVIHNMKQVALLTQELTSRERNLLSSGYKNVVGRLRKAWHIDNSIMCSDAEKSIMQNHRHKIQAELANTCKDAIEFAVGLACSATGESKVFYHKLEGDYYRYLAECNDSTNEKCVYANDSLRAYESALAADRLPPAHPTRLALALNLSVLYYENLNRPEDACRLARAAYDAAIPELDDNKESAAIMGLIRDNCTFWIQTLF